MDPLSYGAIAGVGALAGMVGQQQTNIANQDMVNRQESFQTQMSNTAYQRSTQDMEKAGLNPALMYGSGSAASTPSGNIAPQTSPLSTGISTGSAMAAQAQDMSVKNSQKGNIDADTDLKGSAKNLTDNQNQYVGAQKIAQQITNKYLDASLSAQLKKAKAEGDFAQINQIMGVISAGASSAKSILGLPSLMSPGSTIKQPPVDINKGL